MPREQKFNSTRIPTTKFQSAEGNKVRQHQNSNNKIAEGPPRTTEVIECPKGKYQSQWLEAQLSRVAALITAKKLKKLNGKRNKMAHTKSAKSQLEYAT